MPHAQIGPRAVFIAMEQSIFVFSIKLSSFPPFSSLRNTYIRPRSACHLIHNGQVSLWLLLTILFLYRLGIRMYSITNRGLTYAPSYLPYHAATGVTISTQERGREGEWGPGEREGPEGARERGTTEGGRSAADGLSRVLSTTLMELGAW